MKRRNKLAKILIYQMQILLIETVNIKHYLHLELHFKTVLNSPNWGDFL